MGALIFAATPRAGTPPGRGALPRGGSRRWGVDARARPTGVGRGAGALIFRATPRAGTPHGRGALPRGPMLEWGPRVTPRGGPANSQPRQQGRTPKPGSRRAGLQPTGGRREGREMTWVGATLNARVGSGQMLPTKPAAARCVPRRVRDGDKAHPCAARGGHTMGAHDGALLRAATWVPYCRPRRTHGLAQFDKFAM